MAAKKEAKQSLSASEKRDVLIAPTGTEHQVRASARPLALGTGLLNGPAQRKKFELSGGGIGIHWDQLDEDISVPGLLAGNSSREKGNS